MQRNYISANLWKTTKTCSSIWCDNELTQEFNKFLRRSGKDTAPGPDRIQYCDIKNLTEEDRSDIFIDENHKSVNCARRALQECLKQKPN